MEKNFDESVFYFKGDNSRKRFNDFENGVKLFEKIKSRGTRRSKKILKSI